MSCKSSFNFTAPIVPQFSAAKQSTEGPFRVGLRDECVRPPASTVASSIRSQSDWSKNAAVRRAISSAGTLSMRPLSIHCCPNGTRSLPARS
jgi:hypothetical protein